MAGPYKYLGDMYAAGAYLGRERKLTPEARTEIDDWYAAGPCTRQEGGCVAILDTERTGNCSERP